MIRLRKILNTRRCLERAEIRSRQRRCYSTLPRFERIAVAGHGNSTINLDVYQPPRVASEQTISPAVLIHLPRGPFLHNDESDISTVAILQSVSTSPIVQIHYRLSREQRFPTPVHDVLAGYDWVVENLLPRRAITRAGRSGNVGRVAVCGELIGGGLAISLALTECRIGEPGIVAAAINNPLVDWVSLDAQHDYGGARVKRSRRGSPSGPPSPASEIEEALSLRTQLFKRPDGYFDPFASPILFFRSAGIEVPSAPEAAPLDDMEHLSMLEREDVSLHEHTGEHSEVPSLSHSSEEKSAKVQRKSSRRFPSKALRLQLPSFQISTGLTSPLHSQTAELTNLLRQSITRQSKHAMPESPEFGRKVLVDDEEGNETDDTQLLSRSLQKAEADDKVTFQTCDGLGLWDGSADGKARLLRVAEWLNSNI